MDQNKGADKVSRAKERIFILATATVLALFFYQLYTIIQPRFAEVEQRLKAGTMVNLNAEKPAEHIGNLLKKGYYFEDQRDIDLIEKTIASATPNAGELDNIGEVNKRRYFLPADEAYAKGGKSFKARVLASRALLGYIGDDSINFDQEQSKPRPYPSEVNLSMGEYDISGKIVENKTAVQGVLVRLEMILPQDSIYNDEPTETIKNITEKANGITKVYTLDTAGKRKLQQLTVYARTGNAGEFTFANLPGNHAFKILPLKPGFQFGASKGVQDLDENTTFTFEQRPHTIKLFSTRDFNILKKEKSLIIRTPEEFNKWFMIICGSLIAGFLLLHFILSWKFSTADQVILPVAMMLTGISFLMLLSLQDPLRDRFLAKDSLLYLFIGFGSILLMLFIKLRRFNTDTWVYRLLLFKHIRSAANGWPWALAAIGLLALTILFGTGPEGSGVKVNLFGFQPSEVVKYLIIFFLAGFFAVNEKLISEYMSWKKRWSFFSFALLAILLTLMLFLILGDLGPAMVVCFTFIILFSFSRGDFMFMAGAIVLYVLASWVFENIWISTGVTLLLVGVLMFFGRRQLSESAIMVLVIMSAFLTIDQIPYLDRVFPGPVQRLGDRKAIWQDAWNNEVYGGDQVANGLWAMSTGGATGQGVGQGFAKTIPEAHTDMILPSIGEEFGLTGILCIFLLFLLYLHRSIIIGRRTGSPFLFYLSAGVGVSTFVQFLLIAGGSTGALPLSGVSLPFQSYGGSSLVLNFLAAGFLLSVSAVRGSEVQMQYIAKTQDKNLVPALIAACLGILLLGANVAGYVLNNRKWVVQPALVADRSGARMFSYNPRIAILMSRLKAGTIHDRKGVLMATSNVDSVRAQHFKLIGAGIPSYNLDSAVHQRLDRYYPFEEQLFFWTGDANSGIFNGSVNGYFADYEHAAELRGFKLPVKSFTVLAKRYSENRFLARGVKEMTVVKKDYAALSPLLLAGISSKEVEDFKNKNRDVQLTMDAGLQTRIQKSIARDTSLADNRVSVVIMEASSGDVLTSAVYPLPPIHDWERLTMTNAEQNQLSGWTTTADLGFTNFTQPGSTAKLITAMASFNKLGMAAAEKKYQVASWERIRTKGIEPDETGWINLERAVVKSNNVYFIKLANQEQLQENMGELYLKTGMFLHGAGGYYYNKPSENAAQEEKWKQLWRNTEFNTKPKYDPNNIRKTRAKGISGMAWGQGALIATPAAVARMAAGIANNGNMIANRFVLKVSGQPQAIKTGTKLVNNPAYARLMQEYMIKQSSAKAHTLGLAVAGKTGTPERIWKKKQINDGWYVFFAPTATGNGHIVVCIRIEATKGSSDAVRLAGRHVIPFLKEGGYIKSILPSVKDNNKAPVTELNGSAEAF
ncbi:cell division protein FtsW, lipid II flippase [Pedobacter terrae]|uniref:Cell division protein FtsW, lipid II flippase n=1 Tax=Pedobacter terrae TaxID=405671 RepID=A0A1G8CRA7_9SPHI|nr:FtsW/RodA/SpoVE family cell cycle protein [Pedobacter terrae]SDH47719.1 cell division protein FtsW, lipid II flippase [Pedobacter terrae]